MIEQCAVDYKYENEADTLKRKYTSDSSAGTTTADDSSYSVPQMTKSTGGRKKLTKKK